MKWTKSLLSDQTNIDAISIACGNGYYVAVCIQVSSSNYNLNIVYSQNPTDGWTTRTLKNTGVDNILTAGIVFTGEKFVIPYTTSFSHAFSAIVFSDPAGNISDREAIFSNTYPITLNSVRYVGSKVIVCGTKLESDTRPNNSGWIWYCTDPADSWTEYCIVEYSADESTTGNAFAATYNSTDTEYDVYAVARVNNNTNYHRIYASSDLVTWSAPIEITNDTFSSSPFPTLTYCEDYDALCLFLHGNIYISKANQNFVNISYPTGIGAESIRTATSDGTKFLAPSASNNQTDLKVLYSSGDPVVADNWRIDILNAGVQLSTGVQFVDNSDIFVVLAGAGGSVQPAIFTAQFNANEFSRMKDRVPTYPGRVKLIDAGEVNTYYLTRADDPTEVGTKLSKVNLLSDDAALAVWNNTPPDVLCTPSTALEHLGNNAFHVGDILTTARDLSGDENWLKCTGGGISQTDYPELYEILTTGSIDDSWQNSTISTTDPQYIDMATDGEWFVILRYLGSGSPYTYDVLYTRDPSGVWEHKNVGTGNQTNWTSLQYVNGEFTFFYSTYTSGASYPYKIYAAHAADPSGEWTVSEVWYSADNRLYGLYIKGWTYADNKYALAVNYTLTGYGDSAGLLWSNTLASSLQGNLYAGFLGSESSTNPQTYYAQSAPAYGNGKWALSIYFIDYQSGNTYYYNHIYYSSDVTLNSSSPHLVCDSVTNNHQYMHYVNALVYGNGFWVGLRGRPTYQGATADYGVFYSSDDLASYTFVPNSSIRWSSDVNILFFENNFMFLSADATAGSTGTKKLLWYTNDPRAWESVTIYDGPAYINYQNISASTQNSIIFTVLRTSSSLVPIWHISGKSLPKLSPGVGLNAYIKAKEGD